MLVNTKSERIEVMFHQGEFLAGAHGDNRLIRIVDRFEIRQHLNMR